MASTPSATGGTGAAGGVGGGGVGGGGFVGGGFLRRSGRRERVLRVVLVEKRADGVEWVGAGLAEGQRRELVGERREAVVVLGALNEHRSGGVGGAQQPGDGILQLLQQRELLRLVGAHLLLLRQASAQDALQHRLGWTGHSSKI